RSMWSVVVLAIAAAVILALLLRRKLPEPPPPKDRPRLSPNADSRLRGLERLRETALAQLPPPLRERWAPRLTELVEAAAQLLLWLDANPPPRSPPGPDMEKLRAELAAAPPGPAREAKEQRLALLEARAGRAPQLAEQRQAAVVQLDTLQDLLEDLAAAPLEGR